ncbi:MFS superfamily sulfate permease-like transporter [Streptomyces sp. TE12347]
MTAAAVGPLAGGDTGRYAVLAAGLGVVVGYLAGVALIMIVDQLPRLTGVRAAGSGFFAQLRTFALDISHVHWPTVCLGAVVLVLLLAAPGYWRGRSLWLSIRRSREPM